MLHQGDELVGDLVPEAVVGVQAEHLGITTTPTGNDVQAPASVRHVVEVAAEPGDVQRMGMLVHVDRREERQVLGHLGQCRGGRQ